MASRLARRAPCHREEKVVAHPRSRLAILAGAAALALLATAAQAAPSDVRTAIAVKLELLKTDAVDAVAIDADAADGVVTLHGVVASEAEKTRAAAAARRAEGVERIRNLLAVVPEAERTGLAVADAQLEQSVEAALARDPALVGSAIEVHAVHAGTVLLAGEAASAEAHRRAVELARRVEGVRQAASAIRSPDPRADAEIWEEAAPAERAAARSGLLAPLSDAWTTVRLLFALALEPGLSPTGIDVETRDGVVRLAGRVDSSHERTAAEQRALAIDGVLGVENALTLAARQ